MNRPLRSMVGRWTLTPDTVGSIPPAAAKFGDQQMGYKCLIAFHIGLTIFALWCLWYYTPSAIFNG